MRRSTSRCVSRWGSCPPQLGNYVYTKYGPFPGGMYFGDRPTGMYFMHPRFETLPYWNGYVWNHQIGEWGFRTPPGLQDESTLLLGDSMIYGHGVEQEETVAHILRSEYGQPAYNMARQGDCLVSPPRSLGISPTGSIT